MFVNILIFSIQEEFSLSFNTLLNYDSKFLTSALPEIIANFDLQHALNLIVIKTLRLSEVRDPS